MKTQIRLARWQRWLAERNRLNAAILARRNGELFELEALWQAARADLEARAELWRTPDHENVIARP